MNDYINITIIILLSYLIGSIPTAVIVSKRFFGFDIREQGSGNMGSTNAFRVLGWKWGLFVQIIDILKGVIPVILIVNLFGKDIIYQSNVTNFSDITVTKFVAGAFAVIGHIFSCFVSFKGGKGVNTAAGMLIAIAPIDVTVGVIIFVIFVAFSGYISLGSITAAITIPSSMVIRYNIFNVDIPGYHIIIYFVLAVSILLIYAHRKNILRLIHGNENKFSKLQLFGKK
jgi:glycerol-3-phosphate acyltransferase PlsY